jgi:antitoxin CptB
MPIPPATAEPRRRRLLFRATHRGTKEADLLVGGFVARHLETFDEHELAALEAILDHPDVDLADWLSGRRPVPPEHADPLLTRMMQDCRGQPRGAADPS